MPPCITPQVSLAPYTTLKVGGPAEYLASVSDTETLREVLSWSRAQGLPVTVLGGGSNVLVADAGVPGVVVHLKIPGIAYGEESEDTILVTVGAGEDWDAFVRDTTSRGLWGLENLSGIPGTVGAAPVQNINAYGASVADAIVSVSGYRRDTGVQFNLKHDACNFGYRDSIFKSAEGKQYIITEVVFKLSKTRTAHTEYRSSSQSIARYLEEKGIGEPTSADIREAVLRARRNIGMLLGMYQSAGSFFKNTTVTKDEFLRIREIVEREYREKDERLSPWHWDLPDGTVKISTAFLMECTPYNKTAFATKTWNGTVGLSPLHTLSIVNVNNATATDVKNFSDEIMQIVLRTFGVHIESEVCMIP